VDYGLAYRYMADGVRKAYKEDKKRTHDGTIEFTSRDAHHGVCTSTFYVSLNVSRTTPMCGLVAEWFA